MKLYRLSVKIMNVSMSTNLLSIHLVALAFEPVCGPFSTHFLWVCDDV